MGAHAIAASAHRPLSMLDDTLLREPADRGIRLVALSLLATTHTKCDALLNASREFRNGDAGSDDALHDFRVALRRLRSWLRAFEPWVHDAVSRKQQRRLSEIADATGATRDATVHLEWLHEERAALSARQRIGQSWLSERLKTQRKEGSEAALAAVSDFDGVVAKLTRRLNAYRATVLPEERPARFGVVLSERLLEESDSLQHHLAAISDAADVDKAHRARIAAKRLRYVVEPVAELATDGDAIIETLKSLQDILGDLHDTHVFSQEVVEAAEVAAVSQVRRVSEISVDDDTGGVGVRHARARDPGPGLIRLARRLHERGAHAYESIERDWFNDAGEPFFERVRELAADIARRSSVDTEIERKFLLQRLPDAVLDAPSVEITQGYLPGAKLVERIRRVRSPDGTERWFRTVKAGTGIERVELEDEADAKQWRALWPLTKGRRIRKRRYVVNEWEVDEFLDRTLVIAEIELSSPDAEVELPEWLREVLDREVTDEREYANSALAK
jgi:CHAD domain-containing protein/CYTH domain-containing protein